jgi:DNA integrity scanning protein DisA with diadenylate cyclase activity
MCVKIEGMRKVFKDSLVEKAEKLKKNRKPGGLIEMERMKETTRLIRK